MFVEDEDVKEEKTEEVLEEVVEEVVEEPEVIETFEENVISITDFKSLKEENKLLSNEVEVYKERLLRITAEYENFRKRTIKEKESIYKDSCVEIIKVILPVVDNLERAEKAEGDLKDYKKGVELTLRQLTDSLNKLDIEEIKTDIPFDPNFHEAVMHVEDENFGEKEIIDVFQKGYLKGDRVIRHSIVKVAN